VGAVLDLPAHEGAEGFLVEGPVAERRHHLRGSLTALVTPFRDGAFDEKAFRAFVGWQVENGMTGPLHRLRRRVGAGAGHHRHPAGGLVDAGLDHPVVRRRSRSA
jgi:hypothetical protein